MDVRLPRSSSNWNLEMLVFEERRKPEYPEKNLSELGKEPTTNSTPTYSVDTMIWTRATLVGAECSHHCAILVFKFTNYYFFAIFLFELFYIYGLSVGEVKKLEQNTPVIICCNCPLGRLLKCIQFHKPKPTLLLVFLLHQIPDQIQDILGETT